MAPLQQHDNFQHIFSMRQAPGTPRYNQGLSDADKSRMYSFHQGIVNARQSATSIDPAVAADWYARFRVEHPQYPSPTAGQDEQLAMLMGRSDPYAWQWLSAERSRP